MKIKFLLNPTGRFKLSQAEGDVAEIEDDLAQEIIDAGFAEPVGATKQGKIEKSSPAKSKSTKKKRQPRKKADS